MVTVITMFLFLKVQPWARSSFLFLSMIKAFNTSKNLLIKFADNVTVRLPVEANVGLNESETEVLSFIEWSENNCMKVNLTKT